MCMLNGDAMARRCARTSVDTSFSCTWLILLISDAAYNGQVKALVFWVHLNDYTKNVVNSGALLWCWWCMH